MSHLVVNSPHEVNVERFQSMTSWCNEVEATMDSIIRDFHSSVNTDFFVQINIILSIDVTNHWIPAENNLQC